MVHEGILCQDSFGYLLEKNVEDLAMWLFCISLTFIVTKKLILFINGLPKNMSVYQLHAWYFLKSDKCVGSSINEVTGMNSGASTSGFWKRSQHS